MIHAKQRQGKAGIGGSTRRIDEPDEGQEQLIAAMEANEAVHMMAVGVGSLRDKLRGHTGFRYCKRCRVNCKSIFAYRVLADEDGTMQVVRLWQWEHPPRGF